MLKRKNNRCIPNKKIPPAVPQIFDLLQLSRKERECRNVCIRAMRKLDDWEKEQEKRSENFLKLYHQVEGMLLRRQAQDAILFYRLIRKDRMQAFENYIKDLPTPLKMAGAKS